MKRSLSLASGALFGAVLLSGSVAQAHIGMEGVLKSRTTGVLPGYDNEQKMSPCDGARSAGPVYTFQPGTTITLSVNEAVPHPSYFRIAFDNDGEDGFKEPASIKPIDPMRKCPFNADDQCGASDFCNVYDPNGARVLWDNLDPHMGGGGKYTWNVKLPDIECENCTIQIIQVMEDTVHGAYCPQGSCAKSGDSLEDIYHRCINIKLKRGATNSPGTTTAAINNKGMECTKALVPDAGVADAGMTAADAGTADASSGTGGGTTGGGTTGTAGGGTTGGSAGGTQAGTAGGGTTGGGTTSVGSGTAGGTATTGGTGTAGGTTPGTAGGTTGAGGTVAPTTADDDDGGCSISFASERSGAVWAGLAVLGMSVLGYRRRKRS